MVAAGFEPEKLAIQHVRYRRERMPVPRVTVCECPRDSRKRDAARYDRFSIDVLVVVVINEVVLKRRTKNQPCDRSEIYANDNSLSEISLCCPVLIHPKFSETLLRQFAVQGRDSLGVSRGGSFTR